MIKPGSITHMILLKTLVDVLPPILLEGAGHSLIFLGRGLKHAGNLVENIGTRSVEYSVAQRKRNTSPVGPSDSQVVMPRSTPRHVSSEARYRREPLDFRAYRTRTS